MKRFNPREWEREHNPPDETPELGGFLLPKVALIKRHSLFGRVCRKLGLRWGWKEIHPYKLMQEHIKRNTPLDTRPAA